MQFSAYTHFTVPISDDYVKVAEASLDPVSQADAKMSFEFLHQVVCGLQQ